MDASLSTEIMKGMGYGGGFHLYGAGLKFENRIIIE
jgi:hypothetical protein